MPTQLSGSDDTPIDFADCWRKDNMLATSTLLFSNNFDLTHRLEIGMELDRKPALSHNDEDLPIGW